VADPGGPTTARPFTAAQVVTGLSPTTALRQAASMRAWYAASTCGAPLVSAA
jgi:hypothetical protein